MYIITIAQDVDVHVMLFGDYDRLQVSGTEMHHCTFLFLHYNLAMHSKFVVCHSSITQYELHVIQQKMRMKVALLLD